MRTIQQQCASKTPLAGMEPGPPQVGIAAGMCAFISLPVLALGLTITSNAKVIPHPVDTQSSAEHLIGVKTMSDAFRVIWVGWAVARHSKNNSAKTLKVLTGMPIK